MTGPIRVLHLFDAQTGWEQRVGVTQLIRRTPPERCTHIVAFTDAGARRELAAHFPDAHRLRFTVGVPFLGFPAVRGLLERERIDVVHAWSAESALAVVQAGADSRLVVELFDPRVTDKQAKALRTMLRRSGFGVSCSSATVQRRLIEKGVAADVCTVIRPGVDFAAINACRRDEMRRRLGLSPDDRVLMACDPASRLSGQLVAYWATAIRSRLDGRRDRLILPGASPEQARIARLASQLGMSFILRCPGPDVPFEQLIPIADVLVAPSRIEIPTTGIAWAMAAGVPVIATAVYATAELIAHKHNGLLIKPDTDKRMAVRAAALLDDEASLAGVRETARGLAFEVFSVQRYVDQHRRLYANLLAGDKPGEGIVDSALVA